MHSYCTPEATGAGTISATITGDGWHAILFFTGTKVGMEKRFEKIFCKALF